MSVVPKHAGGEKKVLRLVLPVTLVLLSLAACEISGQRASQEYWQLLSVERLGAQTTKILGAPRLISTEKGPAVEFDGKGDALFIDRHPLEGLSTFTVEVVFRPYTDGPKEQRFFHMQENGSENRVMFETRLTDDDRWFLDTFIRSDEAQLALFAEEFKHPIGPWYHAAIVVDGKTFKHYVNGALELSEEFPYQPQGPGRTSLGARINKIHWYKGAVREARFTPRVLEPAEFLKP